MIEKIRAHSRYPAVLALLLLALFGLVQVVLGANIDSTDKWAWSTNAGWINFDPQCTDCDGVTVYGDHLEGYAWGEDFGWIRMGGYDGGGTNTYLNTTKDNYGVNNDGAGTLSGYAWSTNVGWINFDPAGDEQVTIDTTTGEFDGYAWGENIGWIHFKGTAGDSTAYGVVTTYYPTSSGSYCCYLPLVLRGP